MRALKDNKISPWLVTIGLMFLTWLATYILSPLIAPSVFILFVSAVTAATYYGGYRQGLVATLLVGIINYFFPPLGDTIPNFLIRYSSFLITTFVVSGLQNKRREAELALIREVEKSSAITASVNEAIVSINKDNKIVFTNPAVEEMFGYTPKELIGQDLGILMPVRYRARHNEGFKKYLLSNKRTMPWNKIKVECLHKDGREFPVDISFSEYVLGTERMFTAVIRDMTEERQLEMVSKASNMFAENVKDYAIFVLNENGVITAWNKAADGVYGYTAEEVVGKTSDILYPPGVDFLTTWNAEKEIAIRTGKFEATEQRLKKDGTKFSAFLVLTPLYDEAGKLQGFLKLVRDITEHVEHQEAIRLKTVELEQANKSKDNFLAILSHELRNPLVSILGYSNLLLSGRLGENEQKKAIATIARNAKLQVEMIEDLLDISRIVSGKISLSKETVPICEVVHQVVESFRPAATAKGIIIEENYKELAVFAEADRRRLQQIVFNLLSNAIKFTDSGGKVRVSVTCENNQATIAVEDTGIGIPPSKIDKIFDRFQQAEADTRKHGGLGLGLSIVKTLTELHEGKIEVESVEGKGSKFTVSLSTCEGKPELIPTIDDGIELKNPERVKLDNLKVLVVDDSDEARQLLTDIFRIAGATVENAESAEEGRQKAKAGDFHVFVFDIGMPGENGYSLIKSLRAAGNNTPALALTAFVGPEYEEAAKEAGFDDYVPKPPSVEYLFRRVKELGEKGK
jgi:PAS domain S-box-containing protein